MKILLTGPKASGKTTTGIELAERLNIPFFETDLHIEEKYFLEYGEELSCREIFIKHGDEFFRTMESEIVKELSQEEWCMISTGGGTMLNSSSRSLLIKDSILILLKASPEFLWERMESIGLPPFFKGEGGFEKHVAKNDKLYDTIEHLADIIYTVEETDGLIDRLADEIHNTMMLRMKSPSTFGEIIRTTTFGESHGVALGAVLDGVKPGVELTEEDIQKELDKRKPGQSKITTQRKESDSVKILSGVFEGKTTGTSICMVVYNGDQDSSKYDNLKDIFRPGHADFTFWKKYGSRDHRGGGRSSGRETIGRVASGAIAKKILMERGITITAYSQEIGGIAGEIEDFSVIENNSVRAADSEKAHLMEEVILKAKKDRDSVGGIAKVVIKNCPAGLGDPVFYKLDARLGMAFFSLGAVKGVEFGEGFNAARLKGSENNDSMKDGKFSSNRSGGILGGISNGEDIVCNIAVKPTPSIFQDQETINKSSENEMISIEGRHDPCIVPRIIPVIESMAALVILDAMEIQNNFIK